MSVQLVIAEKPSVARSIAAVIGAAEKQNGYWQGGGYLVSWCIGHLVSFAEAGQYDEKYCKWKYEDLPILPQPWQFIVPDEKKQQFEIVRALLNRSDVDSVTAATDAGREGELIFRFVYQLAGCTKPVKRLWISSMEDAAIREGFANLRPDSDYDALYQSALCRAKADWLVGINATRLFSVLYHKTLTVGRVQTPTLKMLVDRDAKILRFQKEKYYTVGIHSGSLKADSRRIASMDEANTLKNACAGNDAICISIQREKKTEQPPKLYDLTTLQREANRLFGFTAKQTLDYAQQLYEKKLLTYPRTDSQYLTEDMGQTAQHLVSDLLGLLPFAQGLALTAEVGRVLNSKKVSDHHAIIPTAEFVKQGFAGLAESECKLMNLVCSKLFCAVAAPHEYETVTAVLSCAGNEFTAKGKTVLVPAWKEIDQRFRSTLNLYELDYQQHFQHIRDAALPVGANRLIYESGMREIGPKEHFGSRPDKYFGEFMRYEMQPRDPELLQAAIRLEQRSREPARPGDFKEHLIALHTGLIEAEAQRIAADIKRLAAPNSPDKNHFMVEVSPYFTKLASSRDMDQLLAMLPYKSLHLSSVKDRFGIYALIDKNENRDKGIRKPRASVRKQLSETKQTASPKKAAACSKQHEMEV